MAWSPCVWVAAWVRRESSSGSKNEIIPQATALDAFMGLVVAWERSPGASMKRRDFVRAVISVSVAPKLLLSQQAKPVPPPAAPVPWTMGLNPRTPIPEVQAAEAVAEAELRFFSPAQMATLTRLSDLLMPPMGPRPGAVLAQTPAFLDFLIGSSPDPRKKVYAGGLDWLNAESQKAYKLPFAQLENTQADALLKPWLRTWMS